MRSFFTACSLLLSMGFAWAQNQVTFQVDMDLYSGPAYGGVFLNGSFNGWCGVCAPMSDADGDGIWSITVDLPNGNHEYKFTLDGWTGQEMFVGGEPCTLTTGAFTNRLVNISGSTTLPAVCWNGCYTCDAPPPSPQPVTIKVDMSTYAGSFAFVNASGNFNGWCGDCAQMTDANGDDIYELTLSLMPGTYEYKFQVNGWADQENLTPGSSCTLTTGAFTNRVVTVTDSPIDLGAVCWASCAACADPNSFPVDVTFAVDMAGYDGAIGTVNLNGSFNGWCGGCAPMADADGDGVYTLTVAMLPGTYEYKFTVNGWDVAEEFAGGESCTSTLGGYTNRTVTVAPQTPLTLGTVCWNSCGACPDGILGCTDNTAQNFNPEATIDNGACQYLVTLRVDMSNETVGANGVHVAGGFQGWDATATPMQYAGYGVYSITLVLSAGTIEYQFINGNAWGGDENVPTGCGNEYGNRSLLVAGNTDAGVVCFEACSACAGCTNPFSLEFSPFAGEDDGSCATALVWGCTYSAANNFNPQANVDNGSCAFETVNPCPADIDGDGAVATPDLLAFLAAFGTDCN
jgi:hypothetical protein